VHVAEHTDRGGLLDDDRVPGLKQEVGHGALGPQSLVELEGDRFPVAVDEACQWVGGYLELDALGHGYRVAHSEPLAEGEVPGLLHRAEDADPVGAVLPHPHEHMGADELPRLDEAHADLLAQLGGRLPHGDDVAQVGDGDGSIGPYREGVGRHDGRVGPLLGDDDL